MVILTQKKRDVSTGQFAPPLARSLAPLTFSLSRPLTHSSAHVRLDVQDHSASGCGDRSSVMVGFMTLLMPMMVVWVVPLEQWR